MTALPEVLAELAQGGISIITRFDDGTIGAHLAIQLDGDAINRVSPRFLGDAAAQDRHASAIGEFLAQWRRARWLAGRTLVLINLGAFGSVFALHPTWQTFGLGGLGAAAVQWLARLASNKAVATALRRVVH